MQRLRSQTPSSVSSSPNEVSAIPCELFGNTLRALFLKNRDFFWYCEIFLPNTRGPLGCLLGFWPSGPKPCGAINIGKKQLHLNNRDSRSKMFVSELLYQNVKRCVGIWKQLIKHECECLTGVSRP